jgi:hypothetical protein
MANIKPNKGVTIYNPHPIDINIGETTAQDLLLGLGSPLRKFVKEDDRMERIWGGQASGGGKGSMSPFLHVCTRKLMIAVFWDYFQHGFDILISPDNFVSKIILHSNIVYPVHFCTRRNADN